MSRSDRPIGDNELERRLLGAGRDYRSSAQARARTLAAVGLAGSAGAAGAAAGALGKAAARTAIGGWTKVVVGLSLLGAIAAMPALYALSRRSAAAPPARFPTHGQPAQAPPPAVETPAPPPRAVAPGGAPALAAPVASPPPAPSANPPARARARGDARTAAREPPPLSQELAALDAARSALASGNPRGALARLDAYDRTYPGGRLELEAEIVRIDALSQSGRRDLARQRAAAFLRRHPKSVLAARARGFLDD